MKLSADKTLNEEPTLTMTALGDHSLGSPIRIDHLLEDPGHQQGPDHRLGTGRLNNVLLG